GMSRRTPGADLKTQIDAARDKHVTIGTPTRTRTDDRQRLGTVIGPVIDNPDAIAHLPDRRPEDTLPRLTIKPVKQDLGTTLSVDLVLSRLSNLYMAGLQRCYAKGLAADASLAGKVTVAFTVDETGKVDGEASGLTGGVNACIESQMSTWRFPIPKSPKTHEPTSAAFTVSLALAR
nr:AgmX/PglI C-terminal domain-containing protein [Deltaproteobacteria bacterium]